MRLLGLFSLLIFVGLGGGYFSKLINRGDAAPWVTIFPSILSGLLWGLMAQSQGVNLSLMSILFDVVYTAAFVVSFVLMGDRLSPIQVAGFVVSLIGVTMMSK